MVGGDRPNLMLAQVQVFCPGPGPGQDLTGIGSGLDLDLTWDLEWDLEWDLDWDLDLSLTILILKIKGLQLEAIIFHYLPRYFTQLQM